MVLEFLNNHHNAVITYDKLDSRQDYTPEIGDEIDNLAKEARTLSNNN